MINRLVGSLFAPKYPRRYTGRHRAPGQAMTEVRVEPEPAPAAV